jgi:hypothetical protein
MPAVREEEASVASASSRQKGMRQGAKLMFFGVVLMPVFLGLSILIDGPAPLFLSITAFFAGLAWLLYYLIFGEKVSPAATRQAGPYRFGATPESPYLPPASGVPVSSVGGQSLRTAELAQPPSITENTTKLLDND